MTYQNRDHRLKYFISVKFSEFNNYAEVTKEKFEEIHTEILRGRDA